jgi:GNAT superfamily N-acetyltransferase
MVGQGIDIRNGTAGDREIVTLLLIEQLREYNIDTPGDAVARAVDGLLADHSSGFVLIAQQGGMTVGVAYVSFVWTLERGGKSAWLEELYVVPESRNRGIGTGLLAAVLEKAGAAGCAAVDLEVDSTHVRAEHLYARAGFRALSRARWVRDLRPHDEAGTPGS